MSNPATTSSVTKSETLTLAEIDAIRARVAQCTKSWDPSSTPKGTSWSVHGERLVQWTHFDIDGEPTTPFAAGSVQCILKVDTLGGTPVYEWETELNDPNLIQDLIEQEGWVVDREAGSIFVSFDPLH